MNYGSNYPSSNSQPPWSRLLRVNLAVAVFVFLANSSALLLGVAGKAPDVLTKLLEVTLILTVSAAVLVTAVLALVKPEYRKKTLIFHASALAAGATALLIWGLSLTVGSATSTLKVSWSVGWLTAFAAYSAYLVSQTFFVSIRNSSITVKYAYLWVGAIAFSADVFIFLRLAASLTE